MRAHQGVGGASGYLEAAASWSLQLRTVFEGLAAASSSKQNSINLGVPSAKKSSSELQNDASSAEFEGQSNANSLSKPALYVQTGDDGTCEAACYDEAMLMLSYIDEDIKARQANPRGLASTRALREQLEQMAGHLRAISVAMQALEDVSGQSHDSEGSQYGGSDDSEAARDSLTGWGEQLCSRGELLLENRHRITSLACNGLRGLYVTDAGDVFSIGENGTGTPSAMTPETNTRPQFVGELVLERVLLGRRVISVACGHLHSCALTEGGRLWTWGCGLDGRLGHGNELDQTSPKLCEALLDVQVRMVAAGGAHTVAVASPSRVFSWGLGRNGRLGLSDAKCQSHALPQQVHMDASMVVYSESYTALLGENIPPRIRQRRTESIVSVACGWGFTTLLGSSGTVRVFGAGKDGQCGIAPPQDVYAPTILTALSHENIINVSCGFHHAVAVTAAGEVLTWGMGEQGQLGQGSAIITSPAPVHLHARGLHACHAAAGQFHTLCVDNQGRLWGWGSNMHGAVEPNRREILWVPTRVTDVRQGEKPSLRDHRQLKLLAAGAHFSIAVRGTLPMTSEADLFAQSARIETITPCCWTMPKHDVNIPREQRSAAAITLQSQTRSFCSGAAFLFHKNKFKAYVAILTSTGFIELYKELNARYPEKIITIYGDEVELRCKGRLLEAWRTRPGREYSLLLRLQLGSAVEVRAWAAHITKCSMAQSSNTQQSLQPLLVASPAGQDFRRVAKSRGAAWKAAIGNPLRITPELFVICKERATNKQEGIQIDVKRTLPTLLLFGRSGEPLYEQLSQVLELFQVFRPDMGYVQGMSYVAAMLCLHLPNDSYSCFVCLANLLASKHLFHFFRIGQEPSRVEEYYAALDKILEKSSPRLFKHLQKLEVLDSIHMTWFQWLQTMFVRAWPLEQVTQLWDTFLQDNELEMMRACVANVLCIEDVLLADDSIEEVLLHLRSQSNGGSDSHSMSQFIMQRANNSVQVPPVAREALRKLMSQD